MRCPVVSCLVLVDCLFKTAVPVGYRRKHAAIWFSVVFPERWADEAVVSMNTGYECERE